MTYRTVSRLLEARETRARLSVSALDSGEERTVEVKIMGQWALEVFGPSPFLTFTVDPISTFLSFFSTKYYFVFIILIVNNNLPSFPTLITPPLFVQYNIFPPKNASLVKKLYLKLKKEKE